MVFNINYEHIQAQTLVFQLLEFMITLVNAWSFRCVERINDSSENLLAIYLEINIALQWGVKCLTEVANADFHMATGIFSLITTLTWAESEVSHLQNLTCSQRVKFDNSLYIFSHMRAHTHTPGLFPFIKNDWRWPKIQQFLENREPTQLHSCSGEEGKRDVFKNLLSDRPRGWIRKGWLGSSKCRSLACGVTLVHPEPCVCWLA